jgi:hypothetical protein
LASVEGPGPAQLDLLYVAIENLLINVDGHGRGTELDGLLAHADNMKESITGVWQALDTDVVDEIELGAWAPPRKLSSR